MYSYFYKDIQYIMVAYIRDVIDLCAFCLYCKSLFCIISRYNYMIFRHSYLNQISNSRRLTHFFIKKAANENTHTHTHTQSLCKSVCVPSGTSILYDTQPKVQQQYLCIVLKNDCSKRIQQVKAIQTHTMCNTVFKIDEEWHETFLL